MVTIKDIAEACGLSYSTVSIVLGERTTRLKVREETRDKVRAAAAKLGYTRNVLAQQIKTGKTGVIALIGGSLSEEYIFRIFSGAVEVAQEHGYSCRIYAANREVGRLREFYDRIMETRPEAVLFHASLPERGYLLKAAAAIRIPAGSMDRKIPEETALTVASDTYSGEMLAVKKLYRYGHRKIGFLADRAENEYVVARLEGFRAGMLACGLDVNANWLWHCGKETGGILKVLHGNDAPTAICCSSDFLALTLLAQAQNAGMRIPADLSIIGYGGLSFTGQTVPKLVTVSQDFEKIGSTAAAHIIQLINNPSAAPETILLPGNLLNSGTIKRIK